MRWVLIGGLAGVAWVGVRWVFYPYRTAVRQGRILPVRYR